MAGAKTCPVCVRLKDSALAMPRSILDFKDVQKVMAADKSDLVHLLAFGVSCGN